MAHTNNSNNNRIAKNTLLLYCRMLLTLCVSLYTSRVVLAVLGIDDYGLYNVVGGVIAMFGFINQSMTASTQRYLTFALGQGDSNRLKTVFSTSVQIHFIIAILIVILAETVGLWFLHNKMTILPDRMDAVQWVYHISIISTVIVIMCVPLNATIIAHEKMSAFAYISILEVTLKLIIVYLLSIGNFDKLKLYAILNLFVQIIICSIYLYYCLRHFEESHNIRYRDKSLFKEMIGFASWTLWGNGAVVASTQGLNILLNVFFTPAVNAARGIAIQVQSAVIMFSSNFQVAINPQITKSYAAGDLAYMHSLVFRSSKFSGLLLLLIAMPVMLEAETLLDIWLETVPDYTVSFLRIILCISLINAMSNSLTISASATGKIKRYQVIIGGLQLCILPFSYVALKLGGNPVSVFIVDLIVVAVTFMARLFIIRPMIQLSIRRFVSEVLVKCFFVAIASIALPIVLKTILPETFLSSVIVCLVCALCVAAAAYGIGLLPNERIFVKEKISAAISKISKKKSE